VSSRRPNGQRVDRDNELYSLVSDLEDRVIDETSEVGLERASNKAISVLCIERRVVWKVAYGGLEFGANARKYVESAEL